MFQSKKLNVPDKALLARVIKANNAKKRICFGFLSCSGLNRRVYNGVFDSCGKINPFDNWYYEVNMKKA